MKLGDLVEPLLERMREEIRRYDVVQCDETPRLRPGRSRFRA